MRNGWSSSASQVLGASQVLVGAHSRRKRSQVRGDPRKISVRPDGVRRDLTQSFGELRVLCRERSADMAGPRLEWLRRIALDCDVTAFQRFAAVTSKQEMPRACTWCNGSLPTRATPVPGVKAHKCQVCLDWYCNKCYVGREDVGLLVSSKKPIFLDICLRCHRFIDILEWHRVQVSDQLPAHASELLKEHAELAARMTAFATSLAQLEGFVRLAESSGGELPFEWGRGMLSTSSSEAARARDRVESLVRSTAQIKCPSVHDTQVRDGLVRHGRSLLENLKPRLTGAQARANACAKAYAEGIV